MTGDYWIARNPGELRERFENFCRHVEDKGEFPICWQAKPYTNPRSLDQNALINSMYGDIANQVDGEGVVDIRRRCKLHYGVPILRAHDEEFRNIYDTVVKPHDYPIKLEIMDYLPVTSRMKKAQATEYIDTVMREYAGQGVRFSERQSA